MATTTATTTATSGGLWRHFAKIAYNLPEIPSTDFCPTEPSRIVPLSELPPEFQLGNGGSWCRKNSTQKFEFIKTKHNDKGKITHIQIVPKNEESYFSTSRPIGEHIRRFYRGKPCVVCGSSADMVIDHKNDLYNDPVVLSVTTQTPEHFQPLCNSCNLRKRAVSKITRETNIRYGATRIPMLAPLGIDFTYGDETLDTSNPDALVGTYWYDPVAFMEALRSKIIASSR
jgi:hypothetical protein